MTQYRGCLKARLRRPPKIVCRLCSDVQREVFRLECSLLKYTDHTTFRFPFSRITFTSRRWAKKLLRQWSSSTFFPLRGSTVHLGHLEPRDREKESNALTLTRPRTNTIESFTGKYPFTTRFYGFSSLLQTSPFYTFKSFQTRSNAIEINSIFF